MKPIRRFSMLLIAFAVLSCAGRAFADTKTYDVFGAVTYPDGKPAPGLHLSGCVCADQHCKHVDVVTDSAGYYHLSTPDNSVAFMADSGDYVLGEMFRVPETTQPYRKDLKLEYACLVLGQVTDRSTGQPIDGAKVDICGGYGTDTKTNADGVFTAKVPHRGDLMFEIAKDGYASKRMNFSTLGADTTAWRIQLKPGGVIRGKVTDQNGKPVPATCVSIEEDGNYSRSVRTDQNGDYEIFGVDGTDKLTWVLSTAGSQCCDSIRRSISRRARWRPVPTSKLTWSTNNCGLLPAPLPTPMGSLWRALM